MIINKTDRLSIIEYRLEQSKKVINEIQFQIEK